MVPICLYDNSPQNPGIIERNQRELSYIQALNTLVMMCNDFFIKKKHYCDRNGISKSALKRKLKSSKIEDVDTFIYNEVKDMLYINIYYFIYKLMSLAEGDAIKVYHNTKKRILG